MTLDAQLAALLARCSHDEKRVILVQLTRMDKARATLGPLDLARDPRDWLKEAAAEIVDLGFYVSALLLSDHLTASRSHPQANAAEAGPAGGEAGVSPCSPHAPCSHSDDYGPTYLDGRCMICGAPPNEARCEVCCEPLDPPAITRAPAVEIGEGGVVSEYIDWFSLIAKERGLPEDWRWFHSEWRGEGQHAVMLVKGGVGGAVFTRGKHKGKPNPAKRTNVSEIVITRDDLKAAKARWSTETDKCHDCYGEGKRVVGWSKESGNKYGNCKTCSGSGRAVLP